MTTTDLMAHLARRNIRDFSINQGQDVSLGPQFGQSPNIDSGPGSSISSPIFVGHLGDLSGGNDIRQRAQASPVASRTDTRPMDTSRSDMSFATSTPRTFQTVSSEYMRPIQGHQLNVTSQSEGAMSSSFWTPESQQGGTETPDSSIPIGGARRKVLKKMSSYDSATMDTIKEAKDSDHDKRDTSYFSGSSGGVTFNLPPIPAKRRGGSLGSSQNQTSSSSAIASNTTGTSGGDTTTSIGNTPFRPVQGRRPPRYNQPPAARRQIRGRARPGTPAIGRGQNHTMRIFKEGQWVPLATPPDLPDTPAPPLPLFNSGRETSAEDSKPLLKTYKQVDGKWVCVHTDPGFPETPTASMQVMLNLREEENPDHEAIYEECEAGQPTMTDDEEEMEVDEDNHKDKEENRNR